MLLAQVEQAAKAVDKLSEYGVLGAMLAITVCALFLLIRYIISRSDKQTTELLERIDKLILDHAADRVAYTEEAKANRLMYQDEIKNLRELYSKGTNELLAQLVAALKGNHA